MKAARESWTPSSPDTGGHAGAGSTTVTPMASTARNIDRVVAITGGARGIGRATAEAFGVAGAKVAIGDLDPDLAGPGVLGLPLDVTDPASFEAFLTEVESRLGPLDVLVNNAGIMPTGAFLDEDPAMSARILDVNVRGVMIGCRLAGRRFVDRGSGHLINLASLAGVSTYPNLATYCASKHAVVGFSNALYRELRGSGVEVSAVLPGIVRTELSAGTKTSRWVGALSTVDPQDVAAAIVAVADRPKPLITVPKRLALTIKAVSLLPVSAQLAIETAMGAPKAFTEADPALREVYHRRINAGSVTS